MPCIFAIPIFHELRCVETLCIIVQELFHLYIVSYFNPFHAMGIS